MREIEVALTKEENLGDFINVYLINMLTKT